MEIVQTLMNIPGFQLMISFHQLWGIDYGSKKAGTTVICYYQKGAVHFRQSIRNQDADQMIIDAVAEYTPSLIMIDAPLSLPQVYSHTMAENADYFYRQCDRELGAMSPMFLGGLTARAMQLKQTIAANQVQFLETYPKIQARKLGFNKYKDLDCGSLAEIIASKYSFSLQQRVQNFHQLDALLAFVGGVHYLQNAYTTYGREDEGLIIV